LDTIPGFGPALTAELIGWRSQMESQFKFDPTKALTPAELSAAENETAQEASRLHREMQATQKRILEIVEKETKEVDVLSNELESLAQALAQASADLQGMP